MFSRVSHFGEAPNAIKATSAGTAETLSEHSERNSHLLPLSAPLVYTSNNKQELHDRPGNERDTSARLSLALDNEKRHVAHVITK